MLAMLKKTLRRMFLLVCPALLYKRYVRMMRRKGPCFRAIWRDVKSGYPVSIAKRLWAWRQGFTSEKIELYGLDASNIHLYLDDLFYPSLHPINGSFSALIDSKLFLLYSLRKFPEHQSTYYFVIDRKRIYNLQQGPWCVKGYDPDVILSKCTDVGRLVIKPLMESQGDGFVVLQYDKGEFSFNGRALTREQCAARLAGLDLALVGEYIQQHEYASRIFPNALNTLRLLTIQDIGEGRAFVAAQAHRFGNAETGVVDNFAQGGLTARIDAETGCLGRAAQMPSGRHLKWFECHPHTGAPIAGVPIPGWHEVVRKTLAMADSLPFLEYLCWDLAVTPTGFVVVEINSLANPRSYQVHTPLLADDRVRQFLEERGLRTKRPPRT